MPALHYPKLTSRAQQVLNFRAHFRQLALLAVSKLIGRRTSGKGRCAKDRIGQLFGVLLEGVLEFGEVSLGKVGSSALLAALIAHQINNE